MANVMSCSLEMSKFVITFTFRFIPLGKCITPTYHPFYGLISLMFFYTDEFDIE